MAQQESIEESNHSERAGRVLPRLCYGGGVMRLSEAWKEAHRAIAERNRAILDRLKRVLEMNADLNEENTRLWEANEKQAHHIRELEEKLKGGE